MQDYFKKIIKKSAYQVVILSSPCSLPLIGAHHLWFVINKKGKLSRWEVLFRRHLNKTSWGYLHLNYSPAFQGIEIIPYIKKIFWPAEIIRSVEGKNAKRLILIIENSKETYPHWDKYHFLGPNSNTYVQWALDRAEQKIKLPWNAFGKGYN